MECMLWFTLDHYWNTTSILFILSCAFFFSPYIHLMYLSKPLQYTFSFSQNINVQSFTYSLKGINIVKFSMLQHNFDNCWNQCEPVCSHYTKLPPSSTITPSLFTAFTSFHGCTFWGAMGIAREGLAGGGWTPHPSRNFLLWHVYIYTHTCTNVHTNLYKG